MKSSTTVRDILEKWRIKTADIMINPETPGLREVFSLYDQEGFINELSWLIEKEVIKENEEYEYLNNKVELKRNDKREIRNKLRQEQRQALKRLFSKDLGGDTE